MFDHIPKSMMKEKIHIAILFGGTKFQKFHCDERRFSVIPFDQAIMAAPKVFRKGMKENQKYYPEEYHQFTRKRRIKK